MKTNPKLRDLLVRLTALRKKADLIYGFGDAFGLGDNTPKSLYLRDLDMADGLLRKDLTEVTRRIEMMEASVKMWELAAAKKDTPADDPTSYVANLTYKEGYFLSALLAGEARSERFTPDEKAWREALSKKVSPAYNPQVQKGGL
jgi:hypothetical protein